ncbi:MAG TPA: LytTR family DNA-binding domain-containing protein [Rhodanobacteraceae bacterium]
MRILIVDDEPLARTRLIALLGQCADVGPIDTAVDGEAALAVCAEQAPDLLLADINMPGMDGTQLTRRLTSLPNPPQVVFCTAYTQFAAQAYELGAADYLLKPVSLTRLREALERARRLRRPEAVGTRPTLSVRMAGSEHRIALADVLYLEAGDKYVNVIHAAGADLTDMSLRQFEQHYPEQLIRLHRNCLVPRQRLLGLITGSDGETLARLAGTAVTPQVSRRNLAEVRKLLHD